MFLLVSLSVCPCLRGLLSGTSPPPNGSAISAVTRAALAQPAAISLGWSSTAAV